MIPRAKFLRSVENFPKVFTFYVKFRQSFYGVRKTGPGPCSA